MTSNNKVVQIAVKKSSGFNILSREEYNKLSVNERAHLIMAGKIQFLNSSGNIIPLVEGVKDLRNAAT
jgi:hypothetical protein